MGVPYDPNVLNRNAYCYYYDGKDYVPHRMDTSSAMMTSSSLHPHSPVRVAGIGFNAWHVLPHSNPS